MRHRPVRGRLARRPFGRLTLIPARIPAAVLALALLSPAALALGLPPQPSSPPADDPAAAAAWVLTYAAEGTDYAFASAAEASLETLEAYSEVADYAFCKLQSRAGCMVFLDATVESDTFYVGAGHSVGEPASVWHETNGCEGLQRDDDGACAADARLA